MKAERIYLVGFMGAGKSTVARALGKRLGWRVEDVDERIEARERMSISTIFSQKGEPYFRSVEQAALNDLLSSRETVIATGGGTFADPDNRAAMLSTGAVVWLDVPFDRVINRLPPDGRRPLAADRTQLEQLFARRQATYRLAHTRIDGSKPVDEVVERLLEWIGF